MKKSITHREYVQLVKEVFSTDKGHKLLNALLEISNDDVVRSNPHETYYRLGRAEFIRGLKEDLDSDSLPEEKEVYNKSDQFFDNL